MRIDLQQHGTRPLIVVLASIPAADCILNQIHTVLHISIGPLSLLQAIRCPLLLLLSWICIRHVLTNKDGFRHIPVVAAGACLLVWIFVVKELLETGTIAFSSIGAYGQLLYWVVFWACVSVECHDREEAMIILRGLVLAAILSAASILLGYFVGGLNPYADDGVSASVGWFNTAKTVTGVLLTGVCLLLYLGASRSPYLFSLLALLCCASCAMTYARSGQVALALVCVWIMAWCVLKNPAAKARAAARFLAVSSLVSILAMPVILRSDSFLNRWQDVSDSDKGGSGRAAFWPLAIQEFKNAPQAEKLFGYGYEGMATMLFKDYGSTLSNDYGADIRHTHNDFLDVMLLGGVCGILWWLGLMYTFASSAIRNLRSPEGMAGVGIFLVFACQGQLTGQLFGTDSMVAYSVALACLNINGQFRSAAASQGNADSDDRSMKNENTDLLEQGEREHLARM